MSPLTLVASELGSLLNLQDKDMINLLIEMWDGKKTYEKITKMSGNDIIEGPWINMMAGTTPHWIADNMPAAMIGGGLSSRCIFIYGDTKERYTAYVDEMVKDGDDARRVKLIEDLERIAMLTGRYTITPEAREWGRDWYERFWKAALSRMDDVMLEGYAARKQTHIHKVAMVLSASRSNDLIIKREDLELANFMLEDLEKDMHRVFSRIGRTEDSLQAEKLIDMLRRKGDTSYADAYKLVYHTFPDAKDFEGILQGAINSGQLYIKSTPQGVMICATQIVVPAKTIITPDTVV